MRSCLEHAFEGLLLERQGGYCSRVRGLPRAWARHGLAAEATTAAQALLLTGDACI